MLSVPLVIFLGINAFDEPLDPGALAILNSQSKVKPEDNAYLYWTSSVRLIYEFMRQSPALARVTEPFTLVPI